MVLCVDVDTKDTSCSGAAMSESVCGVATASSSGLSSLYIQQNTHQHDEPQHSSLTKSITSISILCTTAGPHWTRATWFLWVAVNICRTNHSSCWMPLIVAINNLTELAIPGLVVKWFSSFLTSRQQRVKTANHLSPWLVLKGGMPQGSWLVPLTFIITIDKLKLSCTTHKYIDDTTLTEIFFPGQSSQMEEYMNELHDWS